MHMTRTIWRYLSRQQANLPFYDLIKTKRRIALDQVLEDLKHVIKEDRVSGSEKQTRTGPYQRLM